MMEFLGGHRVHVVYVDAIMDLIAKNTKVTTLITSYDLISNSFPFG